MKIQRTNLIIHHSAADVSGQVAELSHILGAIQEPCHLASLFQRNEVLENLIQFSDKSWVSD